VLKEEGGRTEHERSRGMKIVEKKIGGESRLGGKRKNSPGEGGTLQQLKRKLMSREEGGPRQNSWGTGAGR